MVTAKIRTLLQSKLAAISEKVYYGTAPASSSEGGLYLVYNLEEIAYEYNASLQELEVDVFDYGEDTAPAELMADKLQAALDHLHILNDDLQVSIYRERRQPLYEDDKLIIRRRLTFQVRAYERNSL